jgi:hypothetical protein
VILPLPERDLKTALNFSVNASNNGIYPASRYIFSVESLKAKGRFYGERGEFARAKKFGVRGW